MAFLILALAYNDLQLPPSQKPVVRPHLSSADGSIPDRLRTPALQSFKKAAGEATKEAAANAAVNAATVTLGCCCCCIQ